MKNNSIKNIILTLLRSISSEKEIRKYIEKFSNVDHRYIIIKVGGAIIQNDLDNLVSSLSFLNQVGLKPIVIHGAGPRLSSSLKEKGINFDFLDGQRITSSEVLDEALTIFGEENTKLVEALQDRNVAAVSVTNNIFECTIKNPKLGYVGEVYSTDIKAIEKILDNQNIPIIASVGQTVDGQLLNLNADSAAISIAKEIEAYKIIFLSEVGGIYDQQNNLISTIDLKEQFDDLISMKWLHSGMKLKLEEIKKLLDILPSSTSVSITKPNHLPRELFTDAGSGTLIKKGHLVDHFESIDQAKGQNITLIIETAFNGKLDKNYFNNDVKKTFYISDCNRAAIIVSHENEIPYMDKFAVIDSARGEGLGSAIWNKMKQDHDQLFWRSRSTNPINKFYLSVCDGFQKYDGWNIYWIGVSNLKQLTLCIESAYNYKQTINYE
jgi:bifunctional N-acetylglutamate synthase/kinase